MHAVGVALGFVIGFALGLLGGGGSILTVPIFVYILGFEAKAAIAMSLVVVGLTSLAGTFNHWREGHVRFRVALLFGVVAMVGTFFGTRLATRLNGAEQLAIFAVVMLIAAGFMVRRRRPVPKATAAPLRGGARVSSMAFTAAEGLVVGSLTGLVGVGGGFLIVPALVWGGLGMGDAVGTSLLAIAMNCGVGVAGYLGHVSIAWLSVAMVTIGTIPGITAGTYAMRFVSQQALRRGFAVLLVGLAAYMLLRNLPA